jgi:hypothetical protein
MGGGLDSDQTTAKNHGIFPFMLVPWIGISFPQLASPKHSTSLVVKTLELFMQRRQGEWDQCKMAAV